jgi:hypothetical protein
MPGQAVNSGFCQKPQTGLMKALLWQVGKPTAWSNGSRRTVSSALEGNGIEGGTRVASEVPVLQLREKLWQTMKHSSNPPFPGGKA